MAEPEQSDASGRFEQLMAVQGRLYAYLFALTGDAVLARDAVQEINLRALAGDAMPSEERQLVAHCLELAHTILNDGDAAVFSTERLLDPDVLSQLSVHVNERLGSVPQRERLALDKCLDKLRPHERTVVEMRYTHALPIAEIGLRVGRTDYSISKLLTRLRGALRDCIENQLSSEKDA